jgi:hypothetical protein
MFIEAAYNIRIGYGLDESIQMGPMQSIGGKERVLRYIDIGIKEGAKLILDGRNPKIIEKLNRLGIEITYEEVLRASGGGQVGRPHFAQVLLEKKYVRTIQDAFDRFLRDAVDLGLFVAKEVHAGMGAAVGRERRARTVGRDVLQMVDRIIESHGSPRVSGKTSMSTMMLVSL